MSFDLFDLQLYAIPNVDVEIKMVKTNLAPRTTVRAPGTIQCAMILEEVLERVANHLNLDPAKVRELNFLKEFGFVRHPLESNLRVMR